CARVAGGRRIATSPGRFDGVGWEGCVCAHLQPTHDMSTTATRNSRESSGSPGLGFQRHPTAAPIAAPATMPIHIDRAIACVAAPIATPTPIPTAIQTAIFGAFIPRSPGRAYGVIHDVNRITLAGLLLRCCIGFNNAAFLGE